MATGARNNFGDPCFEPKVFWDVKCIVGVHSFTIEEKNVSRDIVGPFQITPVIWSARHYAVLPPLVTTLVPVVFFQTSAQASFHFSNAFVFTIPTWNFADYT